VAAADVEQTFQDTLLALFQLHGQVLQAADIMSADLELSGARWQVMQVVAKQPLTVSQVARRLGLQRQSVQRTVDHLRADGIVELTHNVDHARAGLVTLTRRGHEALMALQQRRQAWLRRCLDGVDPAALASLQTGLAELAARVSRATRREAAQSGLSPASRSGSTPLARRVSAA